MTAKDVIDALRCWVDEELDDLDRELFHSTSGQYWVLERLEAELNRLEEEVPFDH